VKTEILDVLAKPGLADKDEAELVDPSTEGTFDR